MINRWQSELNKENFCDTLQYMPHVPKQNIVDLRKEKPVEKNVSAVKENVQKELRTKKGGILYEWEAPEFTKYEKDVYWTAILVIGSAAIMIFFLLTKNYIGALVIAMLAILVYVYSKKEPRLIRFAITPMGIKIENKLHKFEELKSFWIFYEPGEIKELSVRTKQLINPYLGLPLGNAKPVTIRQIMLKFLPEKKQEEPVANILARRLGF